jgi:hypothetical protein
MIPPDVHRSPRPWHGDIPRSCSPLLLFRSPPPTESRIAGTCRRSCFGKSGPGRRHLRWPAQHRGRSRGPPDPQRDLRVPRRPPRARSPVGSGELPHPTTGPPWHGKQGFRQYPQDYPRPCRALPRAIPPPIYPPRLCPITPGPPYALFALRQA